MSVLIAVDPGLSSGIAEFHHGLFRRFYTEIPRGLKAEVIIEKPQVYPRSKADPNNLITLAVQVGRYVGAFEASGCTVQLVLPRQWKGQLPKEICEGRARCALTPIELERVERHLTFVPKSKHHDHWDAVALGLWKLRRVRLA